MLHEVKSRERRSIHSMILSMTPSTNGTPQFELIFRVTGYDDDPTDAHPHTEMIKRLEVN